MGNWLSQSAIFPTTRKQKTAPTFRSITPIQVSLVYDCRALNWLKRGGLDILRFEPQSSSHRALCTLLLRRLQAVLVVPIRIMQLTIELSRLLSVFIHRVGCHL